MELEIFRREVGDITFVLQEADGEGPSTTMPLAPRMMQTAQGRRPECTICGTRCGQETIFGSVDKNPTKNIGA